MVGLGIPTQTRLLEFDNQSHLETLAKIPQPPFAIQVELTSVCNLHCRICPLTDWRALSGYHSSHMHRGTWAAVRSAAKLWGEVIVSGYGEPFLDPASIERLEELDELGVRTSVTTNGQAMTPKLARRLSRLDHLGGITVSIDSPDPDVYHGMRRGYLTKTIRGLSTLLSQLTDTGRVSVSSVVTRRNVWSLLSMPEFLADLGLHRWVLQSFNEWVTGAEDEQLVGGGCEADLYERLETSSRDNEVEICPTQPLRLKLELAAPEEAHRRFLAPVDAGSELTRQCTVPWELPYVDKDGRVFPCCTPVGNQPVGDLREETLPEIWAGVRFEEFRHRLITGGDLPDQCRSCTAAQIGQHPFKYFSSYLLSKESAWVGPTHYRLRARNTGSVTWRQGAVIVGTTRPRDRISALYRPSWHRDTRIGTFSECWVKPGEAATFELEFATGPIEAPESFQLLVDGVCWLPGTEFEITPSCDGE